LLGAHDSKKVRNTQEALGHNSKAVHRAYARKAKVKLPSLESYEKQAAGGQIIKLQPLASETHPLERRTQTVA